MTDINELISSPFVRVKMVAFAHFFLIANAMLGYWGHGAFLFYNFLFMITLLWTMQCTESIEAIQTALVIDVCSVFFDLISIILYFHSMNGWAIIFAIFNLMARPVSIVLLHREFTSRGGSIQTGTVFPSNQQRTYQDIDRPNQPTPTNGPQPTGVASIF